MTRDDAFSRALVHSSRAVVELGLYFHRSGCDVLIPALRVAPTFEERAAYSDNGDLFRRPHGTKGWSRVEVRCYDGTRFSMASGWPWPEVWVTKVYRTVNANPVPECVALVSDDYSHAAFALWSNMSEWRKRMIPDRISGKQYEWFVCDRADVTIVQINGDEK